MSKEREEFERITESEYEGEFTKYADGEYVDEAQQHHFSEFSAGYRSATTHYQPLLAAKDAEIADWEKTAKTAQDAWEDLHEVALQRDAENTAIKALLEQAREGLDKIAIWSNGGNIIGLNMEVLPAIKDTLAAINAATGEK